METRAKILKMKFTDTAAESAWAAASLKEFGDLMPIDPVAIVHLSLYADAETDAATHAEAVAELLGGITITAAGLGIVHRAYNGFDWLNLLRNLYGIKSLSYRGAQADGAEGCLSVPIPFQFPLGAEGQGAPGRAKGMWSANHKMGTSSGLDALRLAYIADVIYGATPTQILTTEYYAKTVATGETDQFKFQREGKLIGLLLFDTTAYDTANITILIDGKIADLDTYPDAEAGRKMLLTSGGIWSGGDAADADCDAEKYTFISFGQDPKGWPEITGKEVTLRANSSTAEAKRLIPVCLRKV